MAIIAESKGSGADYSPMDSGVYVARCFAMLQLGTLEETINGEKKSLHKVRLSFEFPLEKKAFKAGEEEKPFVLSKEYTLSFNEKATLRIHLSQWRGKAFTDEEAARFDITKLLGVPCTINVIHKVGKSNGKTYAEIGSISPVMKGTVCPEQINPTQLLSYDNFDWELFESLPSFLKDKIITTPEFKLLKAPAAKIQEVTVEATDDDQPPF
jgi:hypothetical protein